MTNNSNPNNVIVVRFSFLNIGGKLKSNYKPVSKNITITGSIDSHSELTVSYNNRDCLLDRDVVCEARGTICFSSADLAAEVIELVNNELLSNKSVGLKITNPNIIRYNSGDGSKSLTMFDPSDIELVEIQVPLVGTVRTTAPLTETENFNYEAYLAFKRGGENAPALPVSLSQVRAARSMNTIKTVL